MCIYTVYTVHTYSSGPLCPLVMYSYTIAVIPNLGYTYPQGCEPGHLGYMKKLNNGGKRHILQQCKTRYKSKVVKFIDYINYKHFANAKGTIYGSRLPRVCKWKKVGNHCTVGWGCQSPNPQEIQCFKWELCVCLILFWVMFFRNVTLV